MLEIALYLYPGEEDEEEDEPSGMVGKKRH